MLYCKTYICDLCDLYDFFGCASSNLMPQKMIYYKKYICGLCDQSYCRSKWFVTRFTYVFFVAFINCVDVSLQIFCFRKGFTTRFTLGIFLAFMNWCSNITFGLPHLYIQNSNGNVNYIYLWSTDMKCCWQQTAKEVWVVSTNFGLCIMTEIRFQNQQTTCNCEFK